MALAQGRLSLVALAGLVALAAAGCGGSKTVTVISTRTVTTTRTVTQPATGTTPAEAACTGSELSGTFKVVRGSAGAGQIGYRLTLTNTGQSACFVTGLPQVQLLAADGSTLPTHVIPSHRGTATAALVRLQPGGSAVAEARFSPDVPDATESQTGACEPKAAQLRVTASGGGELTAPVQPPTSVCEHGQLQFDLLSSAT